MNIYEGITKNLIESNEYLSKEEEDNINKEIKIINDDMIKFLKSKGALVKPSNLGFAFDLSKKVSYYPEFSGKFELELYPAMTKYEDSKIHVRLLLWLPSSADEYIKSKKVLVLTLNGFSKQVTYTEDDTYINKLKNLMRIFKEDIEKVLSLDSSDYEQYIKNNYLKH